VKLQELTQNDFDFLTSMENVVDGIATMHGKYTEVVLYSLDVRDPVIIKIVNGTVTGNTVGTAISDLTLHKLKMDQDVSDICWSKSASGKTMRSVTTIIRNADHQPIGLLCINMDMDAPLQAVLRNLTSVDIGLCGETCGSPEFFARNIDEALNSAIDGVNTEVRNNADIPPSKKSREIVTQLNELGIFELKDSTQLAATRLDISVHTIYRYLREIKARETDSSLAESERHY